MNHFDSDKSYQDSNNDHFCNDKLYFGSDKSYQGSDNDHFCNDKLYFDSDKSYQDNDNDYFYNGINLCEAAKPFFNGEKSIMVVIDWMEE